MADFTVRVELHGATSAQYDTLHKHMSDAGYYRAILGENDLTGPVGAYWALPTGEYDHSSNRSAAAVRDEVKLIANRVSAGAWVFVTKADERAWSTTFIQHRKAA